MGIERTAEDVSRLGEETLVRKRAFKARGGFDPCALHILARLLETATPLGRIDREFLDRALAFFR